MIRIKAKQLRQQFKAPLATFFLEIIAKAPASHHFKESAMALVTNGINVIGTNTALYVAKSRSKGMLLPKQIRHERLHAGHVEHNTCGSV